MNDREFKEALGKDPAFTAKMALDFAVLVAKQAEEVYSAKGMAFPVQVSSTLLYILRAGTASLLEIARALDHPHQLVAQRIKIMDKLGLLSKEPDPNDGRRTVFRLTDAGKAQGDRLEAYCKEAAAVFSALSDEVGTDLITHLRRAVVSLEACPLIDRFPAPGNTKAEEDAA